jgi:hypothetical protein
MRVKTWQQSNFLTPNRNLFTAKGDFLSLDGFIPSLDSRALERMPSWTGHIDFEADFVQPAGAFYDADDQYFCFVGTGEDTSPNDALGLMTIDHGLLTTAGVYSTGDGSTTALQELGGNHKQNLLYLLDDYWFIGYDGYVYNNGNYIGVGSPSSLFTTRKTHTLLPVRDSIYMIDINDIIHRYNPDDTDFDVFYEPDQDLNVYHAIHYREHIVMFGRPSDGSLIVYQVDDRPPAELRQLVRLPSESGAYLPDQATATYATPWAIHDDRLFFSPGFYWSDDSDAEIAPIWTFDGNSVELVDNVEAPIVPNAWGLLNWRGRLLLYFVNNAAQHIYVLHGGRFVQILDAAYTTSNWADLYAVAGEIWLPRQDSGTEGWTRLDDFETGVFTSSWLDMDRPTEQKHLSHLAAIVSAAQSSLSVKLEYRTESGSWTEAAETSNARHIVAQNLGVDFYLLQLRVTFTDTGNVDVDLESIAATYSYGR